MTDLHRVLAVTTMSETGYHLTGDRMMATAGQHWGAGIGLAVYAEGFAAEGRHPFADWRDLNDAAPWLAPFKARCAADPVRCGVTAGGGYDFRFDARKFAHKVAALTAAALALIGRTPEPGPLDWPELLVWLDADTLTHAPVTADWLCGLVPTDALLGWLDRDGTYPECGFVAFRPGHPAFGPLMLAFRDMYARDGVFGLAEWHDSYVLQAMVTPLMAGGVKVASLSGAARRTSHVFANSEISKYMDHAKGGRKTLGRTPRRERVMLKDGNPYWTDRERHHVPPAGAEPGCWPTAEDYWLV